MFPNEDERHAESVAEPLSGAALAARLARAKAARERLRADPDARRAIAAGAVRPGRGALEAPGAARVASGARPAPPPAEPEAVPARAAHPSIPALRAPCAAPSPARRRTTGVWARRGAAAVAMVATGATAAAALAIALGPQAPSPAAPPPVAEAPVAGPAPAEAAPPAPEVAARPLAPIRVAEVAPAAVSRAPAAHGRGHGSTAAPVARRDVPVVARTVRARFGAHAKEPVPVMARAAKRPPGVGRAAAGTSDAGPTAASAAGAASAASGSPSEAARTAAAAQRTAALPLPTARPSAVAAKSTPADASSARVFIHHPGPATRGRAEMLRERLSAASAGPVELVEVAFEVSATHLRYFHAEDLPRARAAADATLPGAPARDFTGYAPAPSPGLVEIWLAGPAPR